MEAESSSGGSTDDTLQTLQQMFPQVSTDVIGAVLEQESSFEAAVEALLRSSGLEDRLTQIERDEEIARALQAQMRSPANIGAPWFDFSRLGQHLQDQDDTDIGTDAWEGFKQVATELTRTVSEGVTAIATSVSSWIAPLEESASPRQAHDDEDVIESEQRPAVPETKKDK